MTTSLKFDQALRKNLNWYSKAPASSSLLTNINRRMAVTCQANHQSQTPVKLPTPHLHRTRTHLVQCRGQSTTLARVMIELFRPRCYVILKASGFSCVPGRCNARPACFIWMLVQQRLTNNSSNCCVKPMFKPKTTGTEGYLSKGCEASDLFRYVFEALLDL